MARKFVVVPPHVVAAEKETANTTRASRTSSNPLITTTASIVSSSTSSNAKAWIAKVIYLIGGLLLVHAGMAAYEHSHTTVTSGISVEITNTSPEFTSGSGSTEDKKDADFIVPEKVTVDTKAAEHFAPKLPSEVSLEVYLGLALSIVGIAFVSGQFISISTPTDIAPDFTSNRVGFRPVGLPRGQLLA